MKETEKMNSVRKALYQYKDDEQFHSVIRILAELGFDASDKDALSLSKQLESEGHIKSLFLGGDVRACLTTAGIVYVQDALLND